MTIRDVIALPAPSAAFCGARMNMLPFEDGNGKIGVICLDSPQEHYQRKLTQALSDAPEFMDFKVINPPKELGFCEWWKSLKPEEKRNNYTAT